LHRNRTKYIFVFTIIKSLVSEKRKKNNQMNLKEKALLIAERAHANQTYDIYPYIYHPKTVANIAEELGYDEAIVVACILHDVIEDGAVSYNDIKGIFGEEIAEIVFAVTDELGRNRKERKTKTYPKIVALWKATVVKICDRIANVSHSKEYTPKLMKMYVREHDDFCANLKSTFHPPDVNKAWDRLEFVMHNI